MTKRFWHELDKKTNPVGFGCWQIAGEHSIDGIPNGWGKTDEKQSLMLLEAAISSGVDFFDTAQGYNFGKSEELLGKALKNTNKEVVVCTKISLTEDEINNQKLGNDFVNRVHASLRRLNSDRVDILLIHNPPDNLNWNEFDYSVLNDLKKQGKIGTFGVSARGLNGAKNVVEAKFGTVLEWVFNVFERRPIDILFPLIEQNKFNFIARSPLSRGLINTKYLTSIPIFDDDDFRSTLPEDWVAWTINSLKKIHANGLEVNEIVKASILFTLQYKAVTSTIIGVRTVKQLESILEINSEINHQVLFDNKFLEGIPQCFPKWI